jgi:2,4-dienoyl-CoA reductase-like NADH-dependent reductase (Old Yellow Enzyme family)
VGRTYQVNPDLAERWRNGAQLNDPDPTTFYAGSAEGYTDYPTLAEPA